MARVTQKAKALFLKCLAETGNISKSAEAAGKSRSAFYALRENDAAFSADWNCALEIGTDALEDEAIRRGLEGIEKPVYQSKTLVGHVREYSDRMLVMMLKARRPEKFADTQSARDAAKGEGASDDTRIHIYLPDNGRDTPSEEG